MKKISFLVTRKLLIMALSSQGAAEAKCSHSGDTRKNGQQSECQKGKGSETAAAKETSALILTLGFGLHVITFPSPHDSERNLNKERSLSILVNENLQFSRRLWVGT